MKGTRSFRLSSRDVLFEIELRRNVTVLRGNGATYKTLFCNLLRAAHIEGSGAHLSSYKTQVYCLSDQEFAADHLAQYKGRDVILVFDESSSCIRTTEFRNAIESTGCYFILITRNKCDCFGVSTKEICEFVYSDSEDLHKRVVRMKQLYPQDAYGHISDQQQVITEDACAGKQFFNRVFSAAKVRSSHGKSEIAKTIMHNPNSIVVVDGAAFGFEIEDVIPLLSEYNCYLITKESFEYVILKSGILRQLINFDADNPLVDSEKYLSWERFYTDVLCEITKGTVLQYNKLNLNEAYLTPENLRKILAVYNIANKAQETQYFS